MIPFTRTVSFHRFISLFSFTLRLLCLAQTAPLNDLKIALLPTPHRDQSSLHTRFLRKTFHPSAISATRCAQITPNLCSMMS